MSFRAMFSYRKSNQLSPSTFEIVIPQHSFYLKIKFQCFCISAYLTFACAYQKQYLSSEQEGLRVRNVLCQQNINSLWLFIKYFIQLSYKICIPPWENTSALRQKHCPTQTCHTIQPQLLFVVRNKNPLEQLQQASVSRGSFVSKTGICKQQKSNSWQWLFCPLICGQVNRSFVSLGTFCY